MRKNKTILFILLVLLIYPVSASQPSITSYRVKFPNGTYINATSFTVNITDTLTFNVTTDQPITTHNWTRNDFIETNNYDNFTHMFLASNRTVNITYQGTNANGSTSLIIWPVYVFDNGSYIPPVESPSFVPTGEELLNGFTELVDVQEHLNWTDLLTEQFNEPAGAGNSSIRFFINTSPVTYPAGTFDLSTNAEYNGNPAHYITVGLYNYTTATCQAVSNSSYQYENSASFAYRNWTGLPNAHYRNSTGIIAVCFVHPSNGNSNHKFFIDMVKVTMNIAPTFIPPRPKNLNCTMNQYGVRAMLCSWESGSNP